MDQSRETSGSSRWFIQINSLVASLINSTRLFRKLMRFTELFCKIRVHNVSIHNSNLDALINNKRERRHVRSSCRTTRAAYSSWISMIFSLRLLSSACIKTEWYINRYLLDTHETFHPLIILSSYQYSLTKTTLKGTPRPQLPPDPALSGIGTTNALVFHDK